MTEAMQVTLLVALAILPPATLVLTFWLLRGQSREYQRVVATADERVKMALAALEKGTSRIAAIAFPQAHMTYRGLAGSPDGAQHPTKPHYLNGDQRQETVARKIAEAEQAIAAAEMARRASAPPLAGESVPVTGPLDFEDRES